MQISCLKRLEAFDKVRTMTICKATKIRWSVSSLEKYFTFFFLALLKNSVLVISGDLSGWGGMSPLWHTLFEAWWCFLNSTSRRCNVSKTSQSSQMATVATVSKIWLLYFVTLRLSVRNSTMKSPWPIFNQMQVVTKHDISTSHWREYDSSSTSPVCSKSYFWVMMHSH